MKRAGNLILQIADSGNIRVAYWKATKGKRQRSTVQKYHKNLDKNLYNLACNILTGDQQTGNHHYFTVYDPKKRKICAASFEERVLHHAIMNICEPIFERFQIYDSYACRKGKGNLKAVYRSRYYSNKYKYFVTFDIKKFYDTINQLTLMNHLQKVIKDQRLLELFSQIIEDFHVEPGHGLPIGHLSSQHLANLYLAHLDHFIKEKLGVKGYVRYMDDMIIWGNNKNKLKSDFSRISLFLRQSLQLTIKSDWILNRTQTGLNFLGYRIIENRIILSKRSKDRFRRKLAKIIKSFDMLILSELETQIRLDALLAFVKKADSINYRKSIMVSRGYDQRLEPRQPWRQLEQFHQELPIS